MRAVLALVVTVGLVGCAAPAPPGPAPPPPEADAAAPAMVGLSLPACRALRAWTSVDSQRLVAHLPEGFSPLSPDAAGLVVPGEGDALLVVEAARCGSPESPFGRVFTLVEPPEHLRSRASDALHLVQWDTLVHDEALRARLQAAGLAARGGDATLEGRLWPQALAEHGATGLLSFDEGADGVELNGPLPFTRPGEARSMVAFWESPQGLATWSGELRVGDAQEGIGYVRILSEGMVREIVGAERAAALVQRMQMDLADGELTPP